MPGLFIFLKGTGFFDQMICASDGPFSRSSICHLNNPLLIFSSAG